MINSSCFRLLKHYRNHCPIIHILLNGAVQLPGEQGNQLGTEARALWLDTKRFANAIIRNPQLQNIFAHVF
jgi:hypothetical protein